MKLDKRETAGSRITPGALAPSEKDALSLDVWGFQDTRFNINANGNAELLGGRYELCGHELPRLIPWVRSVLGIELDVNDLHPSRYPTAIPPPNRNEAFGPRFGHF
jgi:hypothetical protein